jgi:hypothetical protein
MHKPQFILKGRLQARLSIKSHNMTIFYVSVCITMCPNSIFLNLAEIDKNINSYVIYLGVMF